MDPATAAALATATLALIQKIIEMHSQAQAGTATPADVLAKLQTIQADLTATEKADDAAADAIVAGRFPATP